MNYQSLFNTIEVNKKYKFLYYGYKNETLYTYITFFNDKRYLYFNRTNVSGALIDSKKIINEFRGIFKVCCKTSFYCLILQEIGPISRLYDLDGVLICTFNISTPSIVVNDILNTDSTYTIFIKDCLLNENLLINLYNNIKVKDIKQHNLNIPFNNLLNFNIDKTFNTTKELIESKEFVNLFNYITVSHQIETLKYVIDIVIENDLVNINVLNQHISSIEYNGLMYYITSNEYPMIIFIKFINNMSYIYNMKFELINIIEELVFASTINIDNFELQINGVINNYKLNLYDFILIDFDLTLNNLNDVVLNNVVNNDLLIYDSITNKWINKRSIDCGIF